MNIATLEKEETKEIEDTSMKIGITGWRGFIGSHLKDKIDNPVLFQGDMRNLDSVKSFVRQCDRIYHIAGKNRSIEGNIIANNLLGTANLVLACRLECVEPEIIFASSNQIQILNLGLQNYWKKILYQR